MGLYFLRHGKSEANLNRTFAGQSNSLLLPEGFAEAKTEGDRLHKGGQRFDVIISSPLSRAKDTAETVAREIGYPLDKIEYEDLLIERGGGKGEGMTLDDFFALSESEQRGLGAESFEELGDRVRSLLARLAQAYPSQDVLLVSHATLGEMIQAILKHDDHTRILDGEKIPNAQTIQLK